MMPLQKHSFAYGPSISTLFENICQCLISLTCSGDKIVEPDDVEVDKLLLVEVGEILHMGEGEGFVEGEDGEGEKEPIN